MLNLYRNLVPGYSMKCPLCNSQKNTVYYSGVPTIFKCKICSFVYQDKNTIILNYEDSYNLDFLNKSEWMYPSRFNAFSDIINRIPIQTTKNIILDIGCGDGQFLYLCKQKGYDISGVEYDKNLSSYANHKLNNCVLSGAYSKSMFPENTFDVVSLIQVLEHIPDPKYVIEIIRYHLKPDGIVIIEVPSVRAPHFLLYEITKIKQFVNKSTGIIPSHCNYFSVKTLTTFLEKSGIKTKTVITGRWADRYTGFKGKLGRIADPIFNRLQIGGILYIGIANK